MLTLVPRSQPRQHGSNLWFNVSFSYVSCPLVLFATALSRSPHIFFLLHHHKNHSLQHCISHIQFCYFYACIPQVASLWEGSFPLCFPHPVTTSFSPSSVNVLPTCSRQRPAMLLNISQCTRPSFNTKDYPVQNANSAKVGGQYREISLVPILQISVQISPPLKSSLPCTPHCISQVSSPYSFPF